MPKNEELLNYYNSNAKTLAEKFEKVGPRRKDIKAIFSLIDKENPNVLEIGCGNGRDAKVILNNTQRYLGIDFSEEMIALARKSLPRAKFKVMDMGDFKWPEKYDAIISFASLVHNNKTEVKNILDKSYEALNNGGVIYISLKHGSYSKKRFDDKLGPREFYYYSKEDLEPLLKNYKIVKSDVQTRKGVKWLEMILQKP